MLAEDETLPTLASGTEPETVKHIASLTELCSNNQVRPIKLRGDNDLRAITFPCVHRSEHRPADWEFSVRLTPFIMPLLKWLGASNKRKDIPTDDIADEPSASETSKTTESVPSTKKIHAYNPA